MSMLRPFCLCAILVLFANVSAQAEYLVTSIPPQAGEKYRSADFRIWIPDGADPIRGVIIHQHGCGRNGFEQAFDVQWQALAGKHRCALLGTHFQPKSECSDWFEPTNGSERALLAALAEFGAKSQHPELEKLPWALWGHSGGSLWAMKLTYRHPERVIAVFGRSGTPGDVTEEALKVPVILNYGEQEKTGRFAKVHEDAMKVFPPQRAKGALWAIAVDPKASHDCRNSRYLAIPFFDAMLAARLPAAGSGSQELRSLDANAGWLGNPDSLDCGSSADYASDKQIANWLPDERLAKIWQEFCRTGDVADKTAPPKPTQLQARKQGDEVELEWQAVADLETGIRRFNIYCDGVKVGSLGGETVRANPQGYYQIWNYGDEPEPRPAPLRFRHKPPQAGAKYEVAMENHAGLESERSEPASAP
jgi:pimeloyl-ACP methyl ester carboxylesterase